MSPIPTDGMNHRCRVSRLSEAGGIACLPILPCFYGNVSRLVARRDVGRHLRSSREAPMFLLVPPVGRSFSINFSTSSSMHRKDAHVQE